MPLVRLSPQESQDFEDVGGHGQTGRAGWPYTRVRVMLPKEFRFL